MKRARVLTWAIAIGIACLVISSVVIARPGGGESFSSGSGSSSSGGGGGGGVLDSIGLVLWLLEMFIFHPILMLTLIVLVVGYSIYSAAQKKKNPDWDSSKKATPTAPPTQLAKPPTDIAALRALDPDFSQVLFEDFAFRLFSTAHRARATWQTMLTVAPYVSTAAQNSLRERRPSEEVLSVVVGAMLIRTIEVVQGERPRILVRYEANVTSGTPGAEHTFYTVEDWQFSRDAAARSKPPGGNHGFPCPNCGAPWQADATGTQVCPSCHEAVNNGRFDWIVDDVTLISSEATPPSLTKEIPEQGTNSPTINQPGFDQAWRALQAEDSAVDDMTIHRRLTFIFTEMNTGWAKNDLTAARAVVSDALFDYLQYWIAEYKKQQLRNVLDDARVTSAIPCKLIRDRWYDALTFRVFATGKDYVVREPAGEIVRGSKSKERAYSEYWTLIRSSSRRGSVHAESTCANCGAPLVMTMGGECASCHAHVTAGEFDWVLSKIEQDDTYRG